MFISFFTSPIRITLPRKTKKDKTYALNLNIYRNLNPILNGHIKIAYCEQMNRMHEVTSRVEIYPISVRYTLYYGSNREVDLSNICCVVDKFFSDWLVSRGIIKDDCHKHIQKVEYVWGGIDKNERVEICISSIS